MKTVKNGWSLDFNPRSPCGERLQGIFLPYGITDFNPRSPCGERQKSTWDYKLLESISIHAPRAGCFFSPVLFYLLKLVFQSTLPMRGATNGNNERGNNDNISIHAPHAGSDL